MIKSFLIFISFTNLLFSSQQIILVVAKDMNSTSAKLQCYEDGKRVFNTLNVNLGANGLGWGLGKIDITDKRSANIIKKEGDKKAPAGIFALKSIFGYSQKSDFHMPYLYVSKSLICIDDPNSRYYNQIIKAKGDEKSFEYMRRDDELYKLGVTVGHNPNGVKGKGSCIFLHIERGENMPTVGCTSMKEKDIKKIASWLNQKSNPLLIQIPKSASKQVLELYPMLESSQLLKEED